MAAQEPQVGTELDRAALIVTGLGISAEQSVNACAHGIERLIELASALADVGDHALARRALNYAEETRDMLALCSAPDGEGEPSSP